MELRLTNEKFQTEIQTFLLKKASLRRKWRWLISARRWVCLYLEITQRENNDRLQKVRQGFVNEVWASNLKLELNIIVKVKLNCNFSECHICLRPEPFNFGAQFPFTVWTFLSKWIKKHKEHDRRILYSLETLNCW